MNFTFEIIKNLFCPNNIKLIAIDYVYEEFSRILGISPEVFQLKYVTNMDIIDKARNDLHSQVIYIIQKYDMSDLRQYCLLFANTLSKFSCTIFQEGSIDDNLLATIEAVELITFNDSKGAKVQELSGLLKSSVDALYRDIHYPTQNDNGISLSKEAFMDILNRECSIITISQLRQIMRNDHSLTNTKLESMGGRLDIYQKINEKLYTSNINRVVNEFKKIYGFDNETLLELSNISSKSPLTQETLQKIIGLNSAQFKYFKKIMFYNFKRNNVVYKYKDVNCSLFTTPFILNNEKVYFNKYRLIEASLYLRRRIINQNIELDKGLKIDIKTLVNESILAVLCKKLRKRGYNPICNKDLGTDEATKKIFENRSVAHEIDLAFVNNSILEVYELKDFSVPFSIDEIEKLDKKIMKKSITRLTRLESLMNKNKETMRKVFGQNFDIIKCYLLLTKDIKGVNQYKNIKVLSIDEFMRKNGIANL